MTQSPAFDHLVIGAFLIFGVVFVVATVFVSNLLSPKSKPAPDRLEPYECGSEPVGPPWVQFRIGYYVYALLFVVFDIETVFLYPWAVTFSELAVFGLVAMMGFLVLITVPFVYEWRRGGLEWD